jgi:hypothetical protein
MMKIFAATALALAGAGAGAQVTVFSTDFNAALAPQIAPGTALLEGVQGYAGLGPAAAPFGGTFLRSATANAVTLSLGGLPTHTTLSLGLLFAAIDSLDGTGSFPSGDFLKITLDGTQIFRESFANALASQIQSYVPPAGVELARRVDLGFQGPGGFYTDSAYDFGADPRFANIAHTASTAVLTFVMEGEGVQSLDDESWAMDNLRVSVSAVPEPETWALMFGGLGVVGWAARRRRL